MTVDALSAAIDKHISARWTKEAARSEIQGEYRRALLLRRDGSTDEATRRRLRALRPKKKMNLRE